MALSRSQLKKRGTTLSGLSAEVVRDRNGNIYFNGSEDEIFVDAKNGDFRLKGPAARALAGLGQNFQVSAGSPAIGAGVPLPEVKTDITGYPRDPVHPTIGAYEYRGSTSDGPPVVYQEPEPTPSTPWQPSPQPQEPVPVPTEVIQQQQAQQQATSAVSVPLIIAGVIGAALLLGGDD